MLEALELSQADAIARAFLIDAELRSFVANRSVCLGCGQDVDARMLAVRPGATRCSRCATIPALARRR